MSEDDFWKSRAYVNGNQNYSDFGNSECSIWGIKGGSAHGKIKQALEKKELIDVLPDKINIQDPVFKHWLLSQY